MAAQRRTSLHSATKGCQGTPTAQRGLNALKWAYTRHKLKAGLQERPKVAPETLPRGERAPRVGVEGCQAKGSAKQVHGSFTVCEIPSATVRKRGFGFWDACQPKTSTMLYLMSPIVLPRPREGWSRTKQKKIEN